MYQALYRKWRPLCFADVIGQRHITDTLRAQVSAQRLSHAYLFTGTRGTGKTTCAKILARAVNCLHPKNGDPCNTCYICQGILDNSILDVVEIDAASNNGVDNVREIRDAVRYAPNAVQKKVFIIDEVHMLSTGAFNALLKTLEEPPPYVMFILATTEIHKVPATILSRCQRFDFRRITAQAIAERLQEVAAQEHMGLTIGGAKLIARLADGAMRDALSMLDRIAGCDIIDEQTISSQLGILVSSDALALMQAIQAGDLTHTILEIGNAYEAGRDLAGVMEQLLGLLRDLLLVKAAKEDVSSIISPAYEIQQLRAIADQIPTPTLLAYSRIVQESLPRIKAAANRRVETELCMIRLCTMGGEAYDTLTGRVEALEHKLQNATICKATPKTIAPVKQKVEEPIPSVPVQPDTPSEEWGLWEQVLERLAGKANMGAVTCLKISSRAERKQDTILVFCEDDVTAGLAKAHPTIDILSEVVSEVSGQTLKIKIYGPDQLPKKQMRAEEILEKAKAFDITVTEF